MTPVSGSTTPTKSIYALRLTHDSLSLCMGGGRHYESFSSKRAYRFAPGKKALGAAKRARSDNESSN